MMQQSHLVLMQGIHYLQKTRIVPGRIWVFYFYDQYFELDVKAFLEGPFFVSQMIPFLNIAQYLPLSQPYNLPPWNYNGLESVTEIPNSDIIDWLLIELRDANSADSALGSTTFEKRALLLKKDGSIVGLDGINLPRFYPTLSKDLYVSC